MATRFAAQPRRARLVELIGPAGAGKSTLARALAEDPEIKMAPTIWGLPSHHLVAGALKVLPEVALATGEGLRLPLAELGQMIRLGALRRAIERESRRGDGVLLVDEGPLFGLAWLEVLYPRNGSAVRARWRRREVADWAALLDSVVRLDASDRVLATRIRERPQGHRVKDRPDGEIDRLTSQYRAALDQVLAELLLAGEVAVHRLRTDRCSPNEIATHLRPVIAKDRYEC